MGCVLASALIRATAAVIPQCTADLAALPSAADRDRSLGLTGLTDPQELLTGLSQLLTMLEGNMAAGRVGMVVHEDIRSNSEVNEEVGRVRVHGS